MKTLFTTDYKDQEKNLPRAFAEALLDSTCGADGTKNLEARMNDVKERYGYYPEGKWKKNFELKAYFQLVLRPELVK